MESHLPKSITSPGARLKTAYSSTNPLESASHFKDKLQPTKRSKLSHTKT